MSSVSFFLKRFTIFSLVVGVFVLFSLYGSGRFFVEYQKLYEYRRLHPELIPPAIGVRAVVAGHENLYADITWIRLIQFIADNIGNLKYLEFTHTLLKHITQISPYFVRAYEADLLFSPLIYADDEGEETEKYRNITRVILEHAESSFPLLCDMDKISKIQVLPLSSELWAREELRNPCISGKIPYYMASRYSNDLHEGEMASKYYKIASMHDDVPGAARILGILALSEEGRYDESALTFSLLALDGYDKSPFLCKNLAKNISEHLLQKSPWNTEWIQKIEAQEKLLVSPFDPKDPLSYASQTCFDFLERGIKQIYLGYITEQTRDFPLVSHEDDILQQGILSSIPKIQAQKDDFFVVKKEGVWKYRKKMPEAK